MSKTIAIYSPKGGAGRTFISVNLAASLAGKLGQGKVLLIDLDLQLPGDILKLLDIRPTKSVIDLIPVWRSSQQLDMARIHELIVHHAASGLDFLPGILTMKQRPLVDEKFISLLLKKLGQVYDYIVIDCGSAFTKVLLSIFENSNLILFVVNPDVLSVSQVRESLELLRSFSFPFKMMRAVLNRADSQGSVSLSEVRQSLPFDIICRIPSEGKAVVLALNRRNPLVLDNPQSRSAKAITALADALIEQPALFLSHNTLELSMVATGVVAPDSSFLDDATPVTFGSMPVIEGPSIDRIIIDERIVQLKQRIHKRILQDLDLHRMDIVAGDPRKLKELRDNIKRITANALADETGTFISSPEARERLVKEIIDEAIGLGPLEDLLADPEITDIMVNNKEQIYIEKHGKLQLSDKYFISNAQVRQIIERIVAPLGRRVDESVPMVDGRLADGSRVNAIIPPLSLTGPTLTIRKFSNRRMGVGDLVKLSSLTPDMGDFIRACVLSRRNIIVSGGTGSGKTTALNVISEFIPDGERIVTIEDAAELKLHHAHWVRLETRSPNIEGRGAITVRDLFRNSLRMRPDRILIGECRGLEAMDMLQAMNTGHDGSMTTIHANSTQDVLARLDSLILMGGIEFPLRAIREMIASAIDIIVHTARLGDGSRKVVQISEITGMLDDTHIGLQDIFVFKQTGIDEHGKVLGAFAPAGTVPNAFAEIKQRGIPLSEDIFKVK
jgi:pilus assembly protein CpaF